MIELCGLGEAVHEGHDGAAALDEAASEVHVGDIGELVVRDAQKPRQLDSVRAGLIQHDEELAVGEHRPRRMALEEIVG